MARLTPKFSAGKSIVGGSEWTGLSRVEERHWSWQATQSGVACQARRQVLGPFAGSRRRIGRCHD